MVVCVVTAFEAADGNDFWFPFVCRQLSLPDSTPGRSTLLLFYCSANAPLRLAYLIAGGRSGASAFCRQLSLSDSTMEAIHAGRADYASVLGDLGFLTRGAAGEFELLELRGTINVCFAVLHRQCWRWALRGDTTCAGRCMQSASLPVARHRRNSACCNNNNH